MQEIEEIGLKSPKTKRPYWRKREVKIDYSKVETIKNVVVSFFGYEFISMPRNPMYVFPRQVYAHLLWVFTGYSKTQIGILLDGKDHSTIIYCLRQVAIACQNDSSLKEKIIEMETIVEQKMNENE